MRQRLALLGALVLGLAVGVAIGMSGSALAFPHTCSGTVCHGSDTDSFGDVCTPGTTTYWEDSYLPANAVSPHLTSFSVMPKPPCAGATVSGPTVQPWPAPKLDPDGKPAQPKADEAAFRMTWTVDVPQGAKSLGSMNVAWSIAWTERSSGGGRTETVTTTGANADAKYDLEVQITAPAAFVVAKAPQRIDVKVNVFNNGPGPSPASENGLVVRGKVLPWGPTLLVTGQPASCPHPGVPLCDVRSLPARGEQSFRIAFLYTTRLRAELLRASKAGREDAIGLFASVELGSCRAETTCANNQASEDVLGRR